jgi:hypothetical protein
LNLDLKIKEKWKWDEIEEKIAPEAGILINYIF